MKEVKLEKVDFARLAETHPTLESCNKYECLICGWRDCPHHEPMHYHHDGCPICDFEDEEDEK